MPPERRRVGLVFQDYALFPHLTVRQNVEYARRHAADEYLDRLSDPPPRTARSPETCRAASASGSRSRGHSRAIRRSCCSTSRSRRSTRTRRPTCASELQELLGALGMPDAARHPRLRGRRGTRRPCRRARRGRAAPGRHTRRARRRAGRPVRRLVHRRQPAARPRRARPAAHPRATGGRHDRHHRRTGSGDVVVAVYPWDIMVAHEAPDESAMNVIHDPVRERGRARQPRRGSRSAR